MRYENIEYNVDEIKNILATKGKRFVDEFLKNNVYMFRNINNDSDFIITRPKETRRTRGNYSTNTISVLDYFLSKNGYAMRSQKSIFCASYDPEEILIPGDTYYFIPLGDYTYTYLTGMDSDFNVSTDNRLKSALNSIKLLVSTIDNTFLIKLFSLENIEYEKLYEIFERELSYYVGDNYLDSKVETFITHFNNIKSILSSDKINKIFQNKISNELSKKSVEVWFNCEEYLLINYKNYDIRELI